MVDDILIGLTTVLFIVLVLLIGSLWFDEHDGTWGNRK
jgi:hypothetical protein